MSLTFRRSKIRAHAVGEMWNMDCISELPDDILVQIASLLTLQEAGRTSVLSKRWEHVWTYITKFYIDSVRKYDALNWGPRLLKFKRNVHDIVRLHKGTTIDELKVCFDVLVHNGGKQSMDVLLQYAIQKRVKRLQMEIWNHDATTKYRYNFPSLSCNSLTSVELSNVDITGKILKSILCDCLALEYLSVNNSKSLEKLKVSGPLLKLKLLRIFGCLNITTLEISAPNLESLCYFGPKICMRLKSVPKLAQVSFGSRYANDLTNLYYDLSSCLSQIEMLSLDTTKKIWYMTKYIEDFEFARLKKLDVITRPKYNETLYGFIYLIEACPFLEHFKLRLGRAADSWTKTKKIKENCESHPHIHLKTVEIVGFSGNGRDLEFAAYLLESALDKITIDTRKLSSLGTPQESNVTRRRNRAMAIAEKLRDRCKPGTKLDIF